MAHDNLAKMPHTLKNVQIDHIEIHPRFSKGFLVNELVKQRIIDSLWVGGYQTEHPVFLWEQDGHLYLFDGHTRLQAITEHNAHAQSKSKGKVISEVPAWIFDQKAFKNEYAVMEYMDRMQFDRRNFNDIDLLMFLQREDLEDVVTQGAGWKATKGKKHEKIAEYLNFAVSDSRVKRALRVQRMATNRDLMEILAGNLSLNAAHDKIAAMEENEEKKRLEETIRKVREEEERKSKRAIAAIKKHTESLRTEGKPASTEEIEQAKAYVSDAVIEDDEIEVVAEQQNEDSLTTSQESDETTPEPKPHKMSEPGPRKRGVDFPQPIQASSVPLEERREQFQQLIELLTAMLESTTKDPEIREGLQRILVDMFDFFAKPMKLITADEMEVVKEVYIQSLEKYYGPDEVKKIIGKW
jgi:hypothetical protein